MKTLTEKEVKEYARVNEVVDEKVNEISALLIKYGDYGIGTNWDVESFHLEDGLVSVSIYHTWAYGGYDTEYISFPQSYLWNDNYEEEIKTAAEKAKKLKEDKKKEKEAKSLKEKEEREKVELIRLNKKYGKL